MKKIIRNAIQCKHCGEVIESYSDHDFKTCKCGAVFVDGGHLYQRIGYTNSEEEDYINLTETVEIEDI